MNLCFKDNYMKLIDSNNYVTKRQSLEILALIMKDSQTVGQLFSRQTTRLNTILALLWHQYRHIRFRALNIFNVLISGQWDRTSTVVHYLIGQPDRQRLTTLLKQFRDYRTKCKLFLDLKPFADKLIDFLDEQ